MINLIKLNVSSVYAIGDIHGSFKSIVGNIRQYDLKDCALIFCGDIGFGFEKPAYYEQIFNKIKRELSKRNIYLIFVRGNHDDPLYFTGKMIDSKRIKTVPDYTVIQTYSDIDSIIDKTILCIGGATSIDRIYRLEMNRRNALRYKLYHGCTEDEAERRAPQCFWVGEQPIYDENSLNEIKTKGIEIDTVCTHTCPSFCQPLTKDGIAYWMNKDERLCDDVDNERKTMDLIYNKIVEDKHPLSKWFYGHYHYYNTEEINGVIFKMLDMERNGKFMMVQI